MNAARWAASAVLVLGSVALLSGCAPAEQQQSILNPAGSRAEAIHGLWVTMLVLGALVWVLVVVALVVAVVRRRKQEHRGEDRDSGNRGRPVLAVLVAGAIVPAVVITVLTGLSAGVLREIDDAEVDEQPMIEIVGHQFWWEVSYPAHAVTTANEIHIPVGERVPIAVSSADVIHSFWVPELGGKIDMIPGRSNEIWLEAAEPGTYWGQCAEYCGTQHAKMRIVVVAHEREEFESWALAQTELAPASPSEEEDPDVARGREVFLSSSCVYCHAVQGTAAAGELGPDLTHLASRETLAAGILPNDRGDLAAWILDPQSIKPGALMPGTDLEGDDLQALLAYLESLE